MEKIKKEIIEVFKDILNEKKLKTQNEVTYDDSAIWKGLDLNYRLHGDLDYLKAIKPFLTSIIVSLEERAFLDEMWKVVNAFDNNHYIVADKAALALIYRHPLFESVIGKLKLKKENMLKQDGLAHGVRNDVYTVQKIIESLEALGAYEYIDFVDYINDFLYSDNTLNIKEKFQVNLLMMQYNMSIGKTISEGLKDEIYRLKLK